MTPSFPSDLQARLHRRGVIAVLMIDELEAAVPVAQALLRGGVDAMELTLRTPVALQALQRIRAEVPEMVAGVGTILNGAQVQAAQAAGAAFGVSPGLNPRTVAEARRLGLPFAPGVCTPTDVELALEGGSSLLKFFPCEPCGGLPYLRSIAAPFAHLGVQFVPLGGVDAGNAEVYLREPLIAAIGGSWLAPRDLIRRQDWAAIEANAREIRSLVERVRGGAA